MELDQSQRVHATPPRSLLSDDLPTTTPTISIPLQTNPTSAIPMAPLAPAAPQAALAHPVAPIAPVAPLGWGDFQHTPYGSSNFLPPSTRDTSHNQAPTTNVQPHANRKRPYPFERGESSGDGGQAAKRSKALSPDSETPVERKDSLTQKRERAARQRAREAKKQAWALGRKRNNPTDELVQNRLVVAPVKPKPEGNLERVCVFFAPPPLNLICIWF